jgi:putative transcriptional regulator
VLLFFSGPTAHAAPQGPVREIAKGIFLIADPALTDPNFDRTVVLITEHGPGGTVGLVINRPTTRPVSHVLPNMKQLAGRPETLFLGGPVERRVLLVLIRTSDPPMAASRVFADVYVSPHVDTLTDVLARGNRLDTFRLYAGYAGWTLGQLKDEIDRGSWRMLRADAVTLFERDPDAVWDEMIQRASQQFAEPEADVERPLIAVRRHRLLRQHLSVLGQEARRLITW